MTQNLENSIINFFAKQHRLAKGRGIGDDAALLPIKQGNLVVASDTIVENVHFSFKFCSPVDVAIKLLHTNISDLLVKGAKARYAVLNAQIDKQLAADKKRLNGFLRTFSKKLKEYDIELLGGDTCRSATTAFSLTLLADCKTFFARENKKISIGDQLVVRGELGGSSYALECLKKRKSLSRAEKARYTRPSVFFDTPGWLQKHKALASLDQSDSIFEAFETLARANKVKLEIDLEKLPFIKKLIKTRNIDWSKLLASAEDLALVAIVPPAQQVRDAAIVGRVKTTKKTGLIFQAGGSEIKMNKQLLYQHFS